MLTPCDTYLILCMMLTFYQEKEQEKEKKKRQDAYILSGVTNDHSCPIGVWHDKFENLLVSIFFF